VGAAWAAVGAVVAAVPEQAAISDVSANPRATR